MEKIKVLMQAHMSSTRLPNKILLDIHGKPDLLWNIERCSKAKHVDEVIVATSDLVCDDIIEEKCKEWGVKCFRGSDSDVLARFYGAALESPAEAYFRTCSDMPLNDPDFIDGMIQFFVEQKVRYVGGNGKNPLGVGGEVFTFELLKEAAEKATDPFEHEHVTPYMYRKQDSIARYPYEPDYSFLRLTLDTPADYEVICRLYDALYSPKKDFSLNEAIQYLLKHPEVAAINSNVQQKGLSAEISYNDIFKQNGTKENVCL